MDPYMALQPQLRSGEQLLWYGVPDKSVRFAPADAFLIPFSIVWSLIALGGVAGAGSGGPGALFDVPFIVIGAYVLVGRFVYKRYRKGRTVYGITSERALIEGPRSFSDLPLQSQPVTVRRSRDGRHASVVFPATGLSRGFGSRNSAWLGNTGMGLLAGGLPLAFYDVADPDAMLAALDQARRQPAV